MPKENLHPEKKVVTITFNDGTEHQLMMALPNGEETLALDVDPTTHPAWREDGERQLLDTGGRVSRFNKKYGNFMAG